MSRWRLAIPRKHVTFSPRPPALPRNLLEALEALEKDELAQEVLGESMLKQFFAYKMDEWDRYHQQVCAWEVNEYLRLY